jgi:hypothetical protein
MPRGLPRGYLLALKNSSALHLSDLKKPMAEKWGPGGALERSRAGYCAEAPGAPGVKKETRSE